MLSGSGLRWTQEPGAFSCAVLTEHHSGQALARFILRGGSASPPGPPPPYSLITHCPPSPRGSGPFSQNLADGNEVLSSWSPLTLPGIPYTCTSHDGQPSLHSLLYLASTSLLSIHLLSACCVLGTIPVMQEIHQRTGQT